MNPRISKLAIASLVCGMAFYIPLAASVISIALGFAAVRAIDRSGGQLLGRSLAVAGISLGFVHGAFWALVIFAGLTYSVGVAETAVVLRDDVPVREAGLGRHYKIPFMEEVRLYPTAEIKKLESAPEEYMFKSGAVQAIGYALQWRVCSASAMAEGLHEYRQDRAEQLISGAVTDAMKLTAIEVDDAKEFYVGNEAARKIRESTSADLAKYGVCIAHLGFTGGPH